MADALSRLDIAPSTSEEVQNNEKMDEIFKDSSELPEDAYPLTFKIIARYQEKDKLLKQKLQKHPQRYALTTFRGGEKYYQLVTKDEKIVIPQPLTKRIVTWYHDQLGHAGITRTEATIRQHLWWKDMRKDIEKYVNTCHVCQINKKNKKKFGLLPAKEAEIDPWVTLCVDLIGPYDFTYKGKVTSTLRALTMIDPATGWFEIVQYDDKQAITIANLVEMEWLSRYPRPVKVIFDRGNEFMGQEFRSMLSDYGITKRPITTRNPQANSIVERVHQTIGDIIRTMELNGTRVTKESWKGILAATAFAVRSTVHTTTQATPGQLVFGRDMMLPISYQANWKLIQERKQQRINENNKRENRGRIPHEYQEGDLVLLKDDTLGKKFKVPYRGPFKILRVFSNGTLRLQMDSVEDTVNIRRCHPYKNRSRN